MSPLKALKALVQALKDGEFYDEHNKEVCYLVTKSSVDFAKAIALSESALDDDATQAQPHGENQVPTEDISSIWAMLD